MKSGLDYFPLDCHMDDSVRLVEAELGLSGFALIIKLWQEIYKGEGYYKKFDKDVQLLFSREVNISFEELSKFLELALNREIFDRALFEKYHILTSKEIQERFLKCTRKRKTRELKLEYSLIFDENDAETKENDIVFKQSKVKESKAEESKEEESKALSAPSDIQNKFSSLVPYGEYKNVCLTDEQTESLLKELGKEDLKEYIRRLDEYIAETGKEYKEAYLTIRRWYREDSEKRARTPSGKGRKNRFVNYQDTGKRNYKKIEEEILRELLEEE